MPRFTWSSAIAPTRPPAPLAQRKMIRLRCSAARIASASSPTSIHARQQFISGAASAPAFIGASSLAAARSAASIAAACHERRRRDSRRSSPGRPRSYLQSLKAYD